MTPTNAIISSVPIHTTGAVGGVGWDARPALYHRHLLPIGGRWTTGHGPRLHTVDARTGEPNGYTATADTADIDTAVTAARHAIDEGPWPRMDRHERAQYLEKLHLLYQENLATMHTLIQAQNATPAACTTQVSDPLEIIAQSAAYADTDRLFGRVCGQPPAYQVRHEPAGVIAAITAFCTPQTCLLAIAAPALLAGCAVIAKPAPQTPLDALYLADLAHAAGLPTGVFQVLPIGRDQPTLEHLVTHPGIDRIALAGSSRTGARVAALCAALMRPTILACGGKNAAIITAHADLDTCVASLKRLSFTNSGQHCANLTRLLVHQSVETEFTERLRMMMRGLAVGDPADLDTDIGPLVSQKAQQTVLDHIRIARESGARLLAGAGIPDRTGWYVYPTLLAGLEASAPVATREVYGPVLTVHTFRTDTEAIELANATTYGLCAAVYTRDHDQADRIVPELRVGTVAVNGADTPAHAPWGGRKHSGTGRLLGPETMAEFQEIKVVAGWPDTRQSPQAPAGACGLPAERSRNALGSAT